MNLKNIKLTIAALTVFTMTGCNSTSNSSNIDSLKNQPEINVGTSLTELSPSDRNAFIGLLLARLSEKNMEDNGSEFEYFDNNYQVNSANGRVVVTISANDDGLLERSFQSTCKPCSEATLTQASTIYEQLGEWYLKYGEKYSKFVSAYRKQESLVTNLIETTEIKVIDEKARLSEASLKRLADSIKVLKVMEGEKHNVFQLDEPTNLDMAMKIAFLNRANVGKLSVTYKNVPATFYPSTLPNVVKAYVDEVKVDLFPQSFSASNEELELYMEGSSLVVLNMTPEFIELKNLSMYYGGKITTFEPERSLLPPQSESIELFSELPYYSRYNHKRLVKIEDEHDSVTFGFAIKYSIKNDEKTLYQTVNLHQERL